MWSREKNLFLLQAPIEFKHKSTKKNRRTEDLVVRMGLSSALKAQVTLGKSSGTVFERYRRR